MTNRIAQSIEELEKRRAEPSEYPYGVAYRRFADAFFERLGQERGGGHDTGQVG